MRSIPLRLKLVVALVLPMMIVAVLVGERVSQGLSDRSVATAQKHEAAQLAAVAAFADAIAAEAVALNDASTPASALAERRAFTDAAFAALADPDLGVDRALLDELRSRDGELQQIRAAVGDDPATDVGPMSAALLELNRLPLLVVQAFTFDDDAFIDVRTTRLLTDYDLVQRARADHARELSAMLRLSSTPEELIDSDLLAEVRSSIERVDNSVDLVEQFGSADLAARLQAAERSSAGDEYGRMRAAAQLAGPGTQPLGDSADVNSKGAVVTELYASISDDVIDDLQSTADDVVFGATRTVIIALLGGIWLLLLTAILQRLMYRAIKSPLDRLTQRARRVSAVDLPEVVAAMRRGDTEAVTAAEPLVVESDDEIGELVQAFNDMHRTAIDLAAEQAGSRRVVADMFINLGRRNQRLVNRLLKRLTALERDERDPDRLAGLYEVDHVATRMRRNAESLLVLAGAAQSRRWDRPVDVYDVARGALSEVESYDRVHVDTVEGLEIHGDVVADLTHLLAELVENAISFSPPGTPVDVVASRRGDRYLVAVADRGIGMTEAQMAEANERIRSAADQAETPSDFLGHYVIGRLAMRHDITVELSTNPLGGVVANVWLPVGAVVPPARELLDSFADPAPESSESEPEPQPAKLRLVPDPPQIPDPIPSPEPMVLDVSRAPSPIFAGSAVIGAPAPPPASVRPPSTLGDLVETPSRGLFAVPDSDTPSPVPTIGALDLADAQLSANAAVDTALQLFGAARRTPGASLPTTSIIMPDLGPLPTFGDASAAADSGGDRRDERRDERDGDARFQLAGFQSGTRRAEQEERA